MSADNGVYILKTPARPIKNGNLYTNQHGKFEYRVAHCQAIDNIDYSDLYIPLLFGNASVHRNKKSALEEAKRIIYDIEICEYGICTIEKENHFPNMTVDEARKALNSFTDDIDSIYPPEKYNVIEILNEFEIAIYLMSNSPQGKIPNTEYFLLSEISSKGEKIEITIVKNSLVEKVSTNVPRCAKENSCDT